MPDTPGQGSTAAWEGNDFEDTPATAPPKPDQTTTVSPDAPDASATEAKGDDTQDTVLSSINWDKPDQIPFDEMDADNALAVLDELRQRDPAAAHRHLMRHGRFTKEMQGLAQARAELEKQRTELAEARPASRPPAPPAEEATSATDEGFDLEAWREDFTRRTRREPEQADLVMELSRLQGAALRDEMRGELAPLMEALADAAGASFRDRFEAQWEHLTEEYPAATEPGVREAIIEAFQQEDSIAFRTSLTRGNEVEQAFLAIKGPELLKKQLQGQTKARAGQVTARKQAGAPVSLPSSDELDIEAPGGGSLMDRTLRDIRNSPAVRATFPNP